MFKNIWNDKSCCSLAGKLKCAPGSTLNSHARYCEPFFPPPHIVHLLFKAVWQEGRSPGGSALLRLYLLIALEQAAGKPWQGWHMVRTQFTQGRRQRARSSHLQRKKAPLLSFFVVVERLCCWYPLTPDFQTTSPFSSLFLEFLMLICNSNATRYRFDLMPPWWQLGWTFCLELSLHLAFVPWVAWLVFSCSAIVVAILIDCCDTVEWGVWKSKSWCGPFDRAIKGDNRVNAN